MNRKKAVLVGATLGGAAAFVIFGAGVFTDEAEGISIDEVDSFQLPFDTGQGRLCQDLAWDGSYLWVIDADYHGDLPEILKIDYNEIAGTGSIVDSFDIPGNDAYLHKGLAWDGTYLLLAWGNYPAGYVYELDPASTGSFVGSFSARCSMPYGLAYEEGTGGGLDYVWTVSNANNYVYCVSRDGSSTISSFDISSVLGGTGGDENSRVPAGLAFDPDNSYIWVAGFGKSDKLYCYTTGGSLVGSISAQTNRPHPVGVTWDASGEYLWYVDACTDTFYRISLLFD